MSRNRDLLRDNVSLNKKANTSCEIYCFASVSHSRCTCTFGKKRRLRLAPPRIVECVEKEWTSERHAWNNNPTGSRFPFLYLDTTVDPAFVARDKFESENGIVCHKRIDSISFCVNRIALHDRYVIDDHWVFLIALDVINKLNSIKFFRKD